MTDRAQTNGEEPERRTPRRTAARWLLAGLVAGATAAGFYAGYRRGSRRAFSRETRLAELPEELSREPATWKSTSSEPAEHAAPRPSTPDAPDAPFAIDVTKPIRITWPLDIGPDISPDAPDARLCLRARQGANEIQTPGAGTALYAFRVKEAGDYRTFFRVRWACDGIGRIACNNSWFAGFDDRPLYVIGREDEDPHWLWREGPRVQFEPGVHWLRAELREDGPVMDRVVIARAGAEPERAAFDRIEPFGFGCFAGEAPAVDPQRPIRDVELAALPTRSLVIGKGHVNEITLTAFWQARAGDGFDGTITTRCGTAPGVTVSGERNVRCGPEKPFARHVLRLTFPGDAARRFHYVLITVADKSGHVLFRDVIRFQKPYVWAFLGPFADTRSGRAASGRILQVVAACDRQPWKIAYLNNAARLGLDKEPLAAGHTERAWKVVSDGSSCDWTGSVDLRRVYGATGPAFAYAVTWISTERELLHRSFNFQADDSGWLWINGRTIAELQIDLPREANRLWSSARLGCGPNPVVAKVTQRERYWGFRFDVIDWHWQGRRGDIITGLERGGWPVR